MLEKRPSRILFKLLGLLFCIVPVAFSVLLYFPVWRAEGGEAMLSGMALVLLLFSILPLFNLIKRALRSPAVHTLWFIAFILFWALSEIADEMTVISFVGFVGNLIGALLFKIADRKIKSGDVENEE